MAEYFPLPNEILLTISEIDGTEKTVVCLTQNDLNITTNTVTGDTFCGTEVLPGSQAATFPVSYRRVWNPDTDHYSEKFLYDAAKNRTHLQFTQAPATLVDGVSLVYTATGYITNYSNTNGTNALPAGSFTLTADALPDLEIYSAS